MSEIPNTVVWGAIERLSARAKPLLELQKQAQEKRAAADKAEDEAKAAEAIYRDSYSECEQLLNFTREHGSNSHKGWLIARNFFSINDYISHQRRSESEGKGKA